MADPARPRPPAVPRCEECRFPLGVGHAYTCSVSDAPVTHKPQRKCGLTTLELHLLEQACKPVWRGFGSGRSGSTYLVGTAQTGGEYRDVDVRTILPDDEFDALFDGEERNGKALWSLMCVAIGQMLAEQTGLPIDYQIQRMTQANDKYPNGNRNPIGAGRRIYAGGGDATNFMETTDD